MREVKRNKIMMTSIIRKDKQFPPAYVFNVDDHNWEYLAQVKGEMETFVRDAALSDVPWDLEKAKAVMSAYETIDNIEALEWKKEIAKLEIAYPPEVLRKLVYKGIVDTIAFVRQYREREYAKNDELRSQGVPFAERIKSLNTNRIKWCDEYESKLQKDLRQFKVRPMIEWVTKFDFDQAKKLGKGMGYIIRVNLGICYDSPNKIIKNE